MTRHVRSMTTVTLPTCAALLLACGMAGRAHAQVMLQSTPIALTGAAYIDQLYGPGVTGQSFTDLTSTNPSISTTGNRVIFRATSSNTTSVNPGAAAIWVWDGSNHVQVQNTDAAFGGGSYTTSGFNSPLVTSTGGFVFRDNTSTSGGLYSNTVAPGRLIKLGDSANVPGYTTNPTFATWGNVWNMNASGSAMTIAAVTGGTPAVITTAGPTQNNNGLWGGTPGNWNLLVHQSDPFATAPATPITDVLVGTPDNSGFSYSSTGKVLWTGALQGAAVNTTGSTTTGTNQGLFSTRNGYNEIIARRNSPFPDATGAPASGGATDGLFYRSINTGLAADMNNAGRVVYSASLNTAAGAAPTTNGTAALFSDNNGTLRTVARHLSPTGAMSNLGSGLIWGSAFANPVINAANTIAFTNTGMTGTDPITGATVTSAANSGLFKMDSTGVFTKVMRAGDSAPAWPAVSGNPALGQVIAGANPLFSGTPSNITMNALGQMLFVNSLSGTGIVSGAVGNNSALFAADTDGSIFLLAQKGMLFHVGPGDDRVIASAGLPSIGATGNQDGRASVLDDNGNAAISLQFTDVPGGSVLSSGVFYFHIPAPSSAALLGIGGLVAARRRRAR